MRILLYVLCAAALLFLAFALYVRFAPISPDGRHVDPASVAPPSSPNFARMAGPTGSLIEAGPDVVGERVAAAATQAGAEVLAGSVEEQHVTYVVRTPVMRFPDLVSIRWMSDGAGTRVDIFSRSIYGKLDLGANTVRVQRWLQIIRSSDD